MSTRPLKLDFFGLYSIPIHNAPKGDASTSSEINSKTALLVTGLAAATLGAFYFWPKSRSIPEVVGGGLNEDTCTVVSSVSENNSDTSGKSSKCTFEPTELNEKSDLETNSAFDVLSSVSSEKSPQKKSDSEPSVSTVKRLLQAFSWGNSSSIPPISLENPSSDSGNTVYSYSTIPTTSRGSTIRTIEEEIYEYRNSSFSSSSKKSK